MSTKNFFDYAPGEKEELDKKNQLAKQEFESLNLDYYTLDEYNSKDWFYFISTLEHYNKSHGTQELFRCLSDDYLSTLPVEFEAYAIGYAEWLSNHKGFNLPENIVQLHNIKLPKTLLNPAMLDDVKIGQFIDVMYTYNHKVSELADHNIICKDIEVVVRA